jgi:hypothetical protein
MDARQDHRHLVGSQSGGPPSPRRPLGSPLGPSPRQPGDTVYPHDARPDTAVVPLERIAEFVEEPSNGFSRSSRSKRGPDGGAAGADAGAPRSARIDPAASGLAGSSAALRRTPMTCLGHCRSRVRSAGPSGRAGRVAEIGTLLDRGAAEKALKPQPARADFAGGEGQCALFGTPSVEQGACIATDQLATST